MILFFFLFCLVNHLVCSIFCWFFLVFFLCYCYIQENAGRFSFYYYYFFFLFEMGVSLTEASFVDHNAY